MRLSGPTFESADPRYLASFYARLLGWTVERSEGPRSGNPSADGWSLIRSPDGHRKIEFQWDPHRRCPTWPSVDGEPAITMHLDIGVVDLDAGVAWAIEMGAELAEHQPQAGVRVMLDPEGNPFCLFPDSELSSAE